ncbi:MAG: HPP family protein [Chloroflexota bacterium]
MPGKTTVADIMMRGAFTIDVRDTLRQADEIRRREGFRYIPALDKTKYVGMITERTLSEYSLRGMYDYEDNLGEESQNTLLDYENIIERPSVLIYPEDSVQKAVKLMVKHNLDYLAVVDWEQNFLGIVTSAEVLMFFNKKLEEESESSPAEE